MKKQRFRASMRYIALDDIRVCMVLCDVPERTNEKRVSIIRLDEDVKKYKEAKDSKYEEDAYIQALSKAIHSVTDKDILDILLIVYHKLIKYRASGKLFVGGLCVKISVLIRDLLEKRIQDKGKCFTYSYGWIAPDAFIRVFTPEFLGCDAEYRNSSGTMYWWKEDDVDSRIDAIEKLINVYINKIEYER